MREIRQIEEPYSKRPSRRRLEDVSRRCSDRRPDARRAAHAGTETLAAQVLSIRNTGARRSDLERCRPSSARRSCKRDSRAPAQLPKPLPVAAGIRDGDYRFTPDGPGDEPVPGTTAKRIKADFEGSFVPQPGKPYDPPPLYFPAMAEPGKGKLVEPGFLSVITGGGPAEDSAARERQLSSGRRRALAEWIASPDNPLTARVMVNRIWHYHFGRGIVARRATSAAWAACLASGVARLARDRVRPRGLEHQADAPADPDFADLPDGVQLLSCRER